MKEILALVEGQTEDAFIREVLNPFLNKYERHISVTIINTKIVKGGRNFKGGINNYNQVKRDLIKLVNTNTLPVTTFIDYYALPEDFPGVADKSIHSSPLERVLHIETCLYDDIGSRNLIPYVQLHEFEALLFTSMRGFSYCIDGETTLSKLQSIIDDFPNPEDINDSPITAPSKRILSILPHYDKPFYGGMIALENSIEDIINKCPHFQNWIDRLISC